MQHINLHTSCAVSAASAQWYQRGNLVHPLHVHVETSEESYPTRDFHQKDSVAAFPECRRRNSPEHMLAILIHDYILETVLV